MVYSIKITYKSIVNYKIAPHLISGYRWENRTLSWSEAVNKGIFQSQDILKQYVFSFVNIHIFLVYSYDTSFKPSNFVLKIGL